MEERRTKKWCVSLSLLSISTAVENTRSCPLLHQTLGLSRLVLATLTGSGCPGRGLLTSPATLSFYQEMPRLSLGPPAFKADGLQLSYPSPLRKLFQWGSLYNTVQAEVHPPATSPPWAAYRGSWAAAPHCPGWSFESLARWFLPSHSYRPRLCTGGSTSLQPHGLLGQPSDWQKPIGRG